MEIQYQHYKKLMKFNGDHGTLIGLRILNNLLKAVTLGIYYPWARASVLKYMYGESEFMGTRFVFHGTGNEMFKGFIKAILIFVALYAVLIGCMITRNPLFMVVGFLIFIIGFMLLVPIAIHGSNRYRLSRTSWRGIHFGYRGNFKEFLKLFLLESFITIITLGIYSSWFRVNMKKYIYGHTRFGNIEFSFAGQGLDLFIIRLKGTILTILTLGIYSFWYMKELVAFELGNLKVKQNGREINLRSSLSAGQVFEMVVVNYLIVVFTLGIGTGIAINRIMRTAFENIEFDYEVDPATLVQTEEEFKDATGDDLAGMLDISFI
jgi:uncharacterized membrane protein YjgN (DUF898 family)